jgi:dihydropteroate synthase
MQQNPDYVDVTGEVREFLASRLTACVDAGISRDQLCVDPGFGFGKADKHNLKLLHNLAELQMLQAPLVVGLSRKRTLGNVTGKRIDRRSAAGVAAAVLAVSSGANIVRTHDVGMTVDALKTVHAVRQSG